jgi:hypothetical protein
MVEIMRWKPRYYYLGTWVILRLANERYYKLG